jgi:hypothetical protein
LVIQAHLPSAKSLATNFKPSLKSKHEVEYEYEHADHHETVCLIVVFSLSTSFYLIVQASRILTIKKNIYVFLKDIDGRPLFLRGLHFSMSFSLALVRIPPLKSS